MRSPIEQSAIRRSSRFSRRSTLLTLAAPVAAGVLFFALVVPRGPERLQPTLPTELAARTVAGAYHIHTTRSDGLGDRTAVAAAAARAGLAFVILTDHGDATRPPDPPAYLSGVLVLDGVEISTDEGHYVAIDMPRSPYPLGGAAEAVVEDVRRLGGFGIAAHPDSPKPSLRWTDARVPIDGLEWLNTDSEWRDESRARLLRAGLAYLFRPAAALATLLDRPATLDRWDRQTPTHRIVGLAGADAHGGVGRRAEDTGRSLSGMTGIPSYEASFRAFSNRAVIARPLSGRAPEDARLVYDAIRTGSVFTAIDALAGPAVLDFHVEGDRERAEMGSVLPAGGDVTIVARASLPRGAEVVLLHDGQDVEKASEAIRRRVTSARGAFRVEVRMPRAPGTPPVPWLVSNPIYCGREGANSAEGAKAAEAGSTTGWFPWRIEKDPRSSAVLRTRAHEVTLEYKLADGPRSNQFVALGTDPGGQPFTSIDLSLAADRPLRVSVQARRADGVRWGRSFYVDPAGTELRIPLSTLRPIGAIPVSTIASSDVGSILLVVDLTNAAPARAGTLRVNASALVK